MDSTKLFESSGIFFAPKRMMKTTAMMIISFVPIFPNIFYINTNNILPSIAYAELRTLEFAKIVSS